MVQKSGTNKNELHKLTQRWKRQTRGVCTFTFLHKLSHPLDLIKTHNNLFEKVQILVIDFYERFRRLEESFGTKEASNHGV